MKALRGVISTILMLALTASFSFAASDDGAIRDLKRQLYTKLRGADPNSTDKYHIDIYFSPIHGMRAYTELLRWSGRSEMSASRTEELRAVVSMGLRAVYRDSGAGIPVADGGSISVAFDYSLPRYTQPLTDEGATTRWNELNMKRQTGAAGVGQSLAAKSLWLRTVAGEGSDVILRSLLAELEIVTSPPFLGGNSGPAPEVVAWEEGAWSVKNPVSRLRSQASLLIGLMEAKRFLDEPGALNAKIKGIERLRGTVDKAIGAVFLSTVEKHRDPETKALVGIYEPAAGRGDRIVIEDLGLAAEALGSLASTGSGKVAEEARRVLREQADFVAKSLPEGELAPRGWFVPKIVPWRGTITTLSEQVAAMMVLIEAHNVLGEGRYLEAARRLHTAMKEPLWASSAGLYRSATGFKMSSYDGYLFGTMLGLSRRSAGTGIFEEVDADHFLETVLITAGLLQAEGPETGEPETPEALIERQIHSLSAELAEMKDQKERRDRIQAFVAHVIDQDGDTVPGVRFGGDEFGGAPVLINQTGIRTPFELNDTADEEGTRP